MMDVESRTLSRRHLLQFAGAGFAAHVLAPRGVAAAETPRRGGVFRIRGEEPTSGFDPHLVVNHHRIATNLSFTHSRLVKVKAGPGVTPGTLPVEPDLAESWSQPNERTYVFRLRKGVRWHPKPPVNGRELTADDVKYTYDRFLQLKGNPNRSTLSPVERIDVLDRSTVKFTLTEPFGWFLDYLANTVTWIVPREAVVQFGDLRRAEACIGTGPWMLERYEPNTRLASWLAGRYDFAPEYGQCVRRVDLPVARQRKPGLRTQDFVVLFGAYTAMKLDREPFRDVRVRRALAMVLDWKQIVETNAWSLGHGVPNPAVPAALRDWAIPIDQLTPLGRRMYGRDVTEAKRLLAEAGYPAGFKTPVEATLGWSPDYVDELQVTMQSWKEAGIDAELKNKEFGAFVSTTIFGKFDKLMHSLRGGSPIADVSLQVTHIPGEPLNASGVDDPKLTGMIRLQRRTLDVAKRREIVYDIQRYLAEQIYYAYGPSVSAVAAWDPRVKNFAPNIGHDYGGRLMTAWLSG